MATFLDAILIGHFNSLFVFLMILVATYAILIKIKVFENAAINFSLAFFAAILFATSEMATKTIEYATPWFIFIISIILFMMLAFRFMGGTEKDFFLYPVKNPTGASIIAIIMVIIFLLAAGQASKDKKDAAAGLEQQDQGAVISFPGKIGEILQTPAVLGLIVVLLIAVFAAMMITSQ